MSKEKNGMKRRQVLKKAGTIGIGGVGVIGLSGVASATYCSEPDDDDYSSETIADTTDIDENIKLSSATELAHMSSVIVDDRITHAFYIVTTAATQFENDDELFPAIREHELEIEVTNGDFENGIIDFCTPLTGAHPSPDGYNPVEDVMGNLTGLALVPVRAAIAAPVEALKTAIAFRDAIEYENTGPHYQRIRSERKGSSEYEGKTKLQGAFGVTHDTDESAEIEIRSKTKGDQAHCVGFYCGEPQTTDRLWIDCWGSDAVVMNHRLQETRS